MASSLFWPEYTFNTDRNDLLYRIFSASPVHRNFSEWRFHFRMPFHIQNAVCNMECRFHSEDRVLVSERRFGFRILRFIFSMRFIFQNIAFLFQNVVCVSECRLLFGIAVAAVCHHKRDRRRDRQTDGRTDTAIAALMHSIARQWLCTLF